jgi:hypothetical protein
VLFPILRRQNEILALGYVTARVIECVFIAVGVLAVLAVVTLRNDVGADAGSLGGYEFLWELSLGVYLTVKGFKPSPILAGTRHIASDPHAAT